MIRPLLAAAMLLGAMPAAAASSTDTLVQVDYWETDSLDPAWAENTYPLYNVYEPLVGFLGTGYSVKDLSPMLAREVPTRANGLVSADGRTYRFPVRKDVKFHDGSTLAPEDVRYSLLRFMLTDRPGGPSASLLRPILGVVTTRPDGKLMEDAYERAAAAVIVEGDAVVVRLKEPYAPFLSILANFGRVVSKSWCAAQGQWDGSAATWKRHNGAARQDALPLDRANGTGPFRVERHDPVTRQLQLLRHDGYWRGPARLRRVVVKSVPDYVTRKLMLLAGDADVVAVLPGDAPLLRGEPGVEVAGGLRKLQSPVMLGFNVSVAAEASPHIGSGRLDGAGIPPDFFADAGVRRAFAHAVDAEAFVREALRGAGAAGGGLIPPGLDGHRPAPAPAFDLARAAALLKEARGGAVWEKGFKLALPYLVGREDHAVLARMLQKHLASLSPKFVVEPRPLAQGTLLDQRVARKLPLFLASWTADYPDAHDFAFPLMHSAGYLPRQSGYASARADALVEKAAGEGDPARRAALYAELQALAERDFPFAPVGVNLNFRVQRDRVKGFVFNPATHSMPYGSYFHDLYKVE